MSDEVINQVIMTDATGRQVYQAKCFTTLTTINTASFVNGVYFVKVKLVTGEQYTLKMIKRT